MKRHEIYKNQIIEELKTEGKEITVDNILTKTMWGRYSCYSTAKGVYQDLQLDGCYSLDQLEAFVIAMKKDRDGSQS